MDDSVERIALFSSMATSRDSDGGGLLFCLFFYWQTGGGSSTEETLNEFSVCCKYFSFVARLLKVFE